MRETKPKILIVHYTYTQQNSRVTEAMAKALDERGCEVTQAAIEFTDKRYVERFSRFPLRHRIFDIVGMLVSRSRTEPASGRREGRCSPFSSMCPSRLFPASCLS